MCATEEQEEEDDRLFVVSSCSDNLSDSRWVLVCRAVTVLRVGGESERAVRVRVTSFFLVHIFLFYFT